MQNCWSVCTEQDVLTDIKRDWMIEKTAEIVAEAQSLFRTRTRTGKLIFAESTGKYARTYETYDTEGKLAPYNLEPECAKDARVTYRLPVHDDYCLVGFDADVLFFPTMAQWSPFTAGFGGDTASDQYGRPVMVTMGFAPPANGDPTGHEFQRGMNWDSYVSGAVTFDYRQVIMHELIHGLGFNIYTFQSVYTKDGKQRHIVDSRQYEDEKCVELGNEYTCVKLGIDGAVWTAIGDRVVQVAREYFGDDAIDGVPLMGENQLGDSSRGSHWETRVLREELLSYGGGTKISAFTLAMMEDTGHYIANYNQAEHLTWGRKQGIWFVKSRCGIRSNYWKSTADAASLQDFKTGPAGAGQCQTKDWRGDMAYERSQGRDGAAALLEQYCQPTACNPYLPDCPCPIECNTVPDTITTEQGCTCLAKSTHAVDGREHFGCGNSSIPSDWCVEFADKLDANDIPTGATNPAACPTGATDLPACLRAPAGPPHHWCSVSSGCAAAPGLSADGTRYDTCTSAAGLKVPSGSIAAAGVKHVIPTSDNTTSITILFSTLGVIVMFIYAALVLVCLGPKNYKCIL